MNFDIDGDRNEFHKRCSRRTVSSNSEEAEEICAVMVYPQMTLNDGIGATRNIDNVRSATLPNHVKFIPRVKRFMFYIGRAFTFFPIYVKDEHLFSISYVCSGASKIWYIVSIAYKSHFEVLFGKRFWTCSMSKTITAVATDYCFETHSIHENFRPSLPLSCYVQRQS